MAAIPPGWYPDPGNPAWRRFWDGTAWTGQLAIPQQPAREPHPTLPLAVAIGAIAALAVPLVLSRFLLGAVADEHWPLPLYVALAGVLAYGPSLAWWWFASRRWGSGHSCLDVGFTAKAVDAGWGPVTWLACLGAQVFVASIVVALGIPFEGNVESLREGREHLDFILPMVVLAVVVAPLVEELVFRGLVLRGLLSRFAPWGAVAIQAVLFGSAHYDPDRGAGNIGLVMVLSAVGAVLGGAAYLVRRLGPSIIAHAMINGIAIAIALSGWTPASQ